MGTKKRQAEPVPAKELGRTARRTRRQRAAPLEGTRIASQIKKTGRLPPPTPKNKSMSEVLEMDPDSPEFKHPRGRPRKWHDTPDEELSWADLIRKHKQGRVNKRRAAVRQWEAAIAVGQQNGELPMMTGSGPETEQGVGAEDAAVADLVLPLEFWSNEELIRGYRRNRAGRFGTPPKYIPREVQQQAIRILMQRGENKLREAYNESIAELVRLAQTADSEKVRLEAVKEIMIRVAGKVPDRVMVSQDDPYVDILIDSVVPLSDVPPVDVVGHKRPQLGGAVEAPSSTHRATSASSDGVPVRDVAAPAPSRRIKGKRPQHRQASGDGDE